jgi:DtxR family transcriptional regulator, Mn-dependent transcriptional regulator
MHSLNEGATGLLSLDEAGQGEIVSDTTRSHLSASQEMYLKTIHQLCHEQKVARVKDIASRLQVTMSSVNGAIKHLVALRLCEHSHYGYVDLTTLGTHLATEIHERYHTLETYLCEHLGVIKEIAEQDACEMEHIVSPQTLDRIATWQRFFNSLGDEGKDLQKRYSAFLKTEMGDEPTASDFHTLPR